MYITNNSSTSFGSFRISYNAEEKLAKLPARKLGKMLVKCRNLEDTSFMDLEILSDLTPRIREKGFVESGMVPPFKVKAPKGNTLEIVAHQYKGKKSQNCIAYAKFRSNEEAVQAYKEIARAEEDFEKAALITRAIDDSKIHEYEIANPVKYKNTLAQGLINKFGDIVKE